MVKMPVLDWIEGFSGAVDACGAELRLGRTPLKDIRMQAVSSYSDADLRNALSRLTRQAISGGCEDNLATVFAMVNEAISRRLGAWRFFDPLIDPIREQSGLLVFHQLADRISHIPDFEQAANNWRRNGSTCWESFDRAVTPVLVHQGLDPRDRVLVVTILFLRHRSQVELAGSILLPSCFYQALQAQDQDGVLIFRATDE